MNLTLAAVIYLLAGIVITDGMPQNMPQNDRWCCAVATPLYESCPSEHITCCEGLVLWLGGCFRYAQEFGEIVRYSSRLNRKERQLFENIQQWLPWDTNYENRLKTLLRDLAALRE
ncbi:unnamed protein product [Owenia fusiformis]|uniref:Uncharacterized protein n=1 Tax=Owenia fusiformis TaxID=6347 RepID=A0A8J1T6Q0_OWEFU|nr:unnamed protein product [Owenia fusiformis]